MHLFFKRFLTLFILLFTTSFPIHFDSWLNVIHYFTQLWEWFYGLLSPFFFEGKYSPILSDSKGLLLHLTFLVVSCFIGAGIWSFLQPKENKERKHYFAVFVAYYLSLQLIIYGLNKLFLIQFSPPTSNLLYTNLGDISKDLLFWISMSTSPLYNYFMGGIELLAALLLLYYRTRLLGSLLAIGIFINIVFINFSFDISVKFFSSFLLFLSLFIAAPSLKSLYSFFILNKARQLRIWRPIYKTKQQQYLYWSLKAVVIFSFLGIGFQPYYNSLNKVSKTINEIGFSETYEVLNENNLGWKRVYLHPKSYFIVENKAEEFNDYELVIALNNNQFILNNSVVLNFEHLKNGELKLTGLWNKNPVSFVLKPMKKAEFNLLKHQFHWTID